MMPRFCSASLLSGAAMFVALLHTGCADDTTDTKLPGNGPSLSDDANQVSDLPAGDSTGSRCVAPTDADFAAFQTKVAGLLGGPVTVDPCSTTMFDTYKDAGFAAVTEQIVERSLKADMVAKIGTSFQDKLAQASETRQAQFVSHLKLFLEQVYSTQQLYPADAPSMPDAHRGLEITFDQYLAFATEVVVPSLKAVGVSEDHINKCFVPPVLLDATVRSMVFCR